MKKLIAILLTVALLCCVSCGGESTPAVTTNGDGATQPTPSTPDPEIDHTDYKALTNAKFAEISDAPASDFSCETGADGVTVTAYLGSAERVRIPSEIGGVAVVRIADGAFADKTALKTLYIPDGVTSVGVGVLRGCTSLEALHIPTVFANANGTRFIGYLFGGEEYADHLMCMPASLKFVRLGGGDPTVTASAFAECEELVCVLLSERTTTLSSFAFYGCKSLKYVNVEHLTKMDAYAFASCQSLVRAELGASMTNIGLGAFQGCASLSSVTVPFVGGSSGENTFFGYIFGAENAQYTAGFLPAYLRRVTVLDTCTSLGDYAFYECSSIQTVTLSQGITTIGVRAFERCTSLTSVNLPASLRHIRENAFVGCKALTSVTFGDQVDTLGVNAFYGCTSLREIRLPQSLTHLPASAFADCRSLETVDLGGVTRVGKNAFHNCTAIRTVSAPANVEFEDGNDTLKTAMGME